MKSTSINPPPRLPKAVLQACRILRDSGRKAWLAGGCVRDLLLARKPRDWDVVTDAPLAEIQKLFPEGLQVGVAFGIVKLPPSGTKSEPVNVDVAMFRRESGYSDRRHPDAVEPGDEQSDVARRDFTVNAMYLDPVTNEVIDREGGRRDLAAKLIRAVGAPAERFSEDALRMVRAVRFSAQLGFKIERETAAALKKCSGLLKDISRERIREELVRLLESPRPLMGLEALAQNGLWEQVFGVRRIAIPADFRQMRFPAPPTAIHWLCALGVTGLLGDPIRESAAIVERLTDLLKLTNEERRVLGRVLRIYGDAAADLPKDAPQEWVELARNDKVLIDVIRSFVRRARGPTESEKQQALAHTDLALRWASRPGSERAWPTAAALMKEGYKSGPALGAELRARQWQAFRKGKPSA